MLTSTNPSLANNLVNYTVLPTQASNETYIVQTDAPESTASLMKNTVFIELVIPLEPEEKEELKMDEIKLISVL